MISQFIRQCPCCQVVGRIHLQIKTHPFTCASYNPFEILHLDHIGQTLKDLHSSWSLSMRSRGGLNYIPLRLQLQSRQRHVSSSISGTAFHNEIIEELLRMTGVEQSLTMAYSSEENCIVERANKKYYGIPMRSCLTQGSMTDGRLNSYLWYRE